MVVHVEIPAEDLERAMTFYRSVFQVEFGPIVELHGNRMAHFPFHHEGDGASCALAQGSVYRPTKDGCIVYLAVEDIDAVMSRAVAAGSTVLFEKTEVDAALFVAEIEDSEGNRIAVQTNPES